MAAKRAHEVSFDYIKWRLAEEGYEWVACPKLSKHDAKRLLMRKVMIISVYQFTLDGKEV